MDNPIIGLDIFFEKFMGAQLETPQTQKTAISIRYKNHIVRATTPLYDPDKMMLDNERIIADFIDTVGIEEILKKQAVYVTLCRK